jgi:hypothetical protein
MILSTIPFKGSEGEVQRKHTMRRAWCQAWGDEKFCQKAGATLQRRRPGGRGLRGGVPVAPPSRRPALACWRRGPEGERSPWRSVEPPGRRRYRRQPPIGGGTAMKNHSEVGMTNFDSTHIKLSCMNPIRVL